MTGALATALVAFQKELPKVGKDRTADTGKFKYTYADLGTLTHTVFPLLTKHGLAFSTFGRANGEGYEIVGVLIHESGETLEGALPLYGRSPQEIGSGVTYARRYLLGSMTGVVTEDDDDAQTAQRQPQRTSTVDWDAVCDTAESMTDPEDVRGLWRSHKIGSNTPQYVKDRLTAHLQTLVGEEAP